MKVLEVYDKNNFKNLKYDEERTITGIMNTFFSQYPKKYRKNYNRNLLHLEIYHLDEITNEARAEYFPSIDKTIYISNEHIIHELMHLAHYDRKRDLMAIEQNERFWEDPLIEGAAEYLASEATGEINYSYIFETFVIRMLSSIDNFFEPFFIPNYKKFIALFPNKNDIIILMYALNFYHHNYNIEESSPEYQYAIPILKDSIKEVIDCLINIEASFNKDINASLLYKEKFMSLITDEFVDLNLSEYFSDYQNYAYSEIKKKLLRR